MPAQSAIPVNRGSLSAKVQLADLGKVHPKREYMTEAKKYKLDPARVYEYLVRVRKQVK